MRSTPEAPPAQFPAPGLIGDTSTAPVSIAIIGGGPGGLMAAYLLERKAGFPCEITLFEGSERLGGKILTRQFTTDPWIYYEAGAAEFYEYTQLGPDPLRELIGELGLETSPMQGGGAIFRNRVIHDLDDLRREMGEATWQAVKDFQAQARALISPADYYESDWREGKEDALTLRSFHELLEGVPDEAAREYIRIMAHSDLACEPHQTSASYGLQNHLMDEPDYMQIYSIDGGNERLTRELAQRLSATILLNQPVVRVERSSEYEYLVTSRRDGALETEEFDYVIVALPNDWISAIDWGGEGLGEAMARHHQFYDRPAHYLRVTALFDRPFWRDQIGGSFFVSDAFGGCCLYDESSRFDSGGKGVLAWLLAGEAALRMSNLDREKIVAQVLDLLPAVLEPGRAQCLEASVDRWLGSVNALPSGFPARDPDSRHLPEPLEHPGLFVMGDYLFDATINGVLDSASTVVEWIIEDCLDEIAMADKGSLSVV